MDNIKDKMKNNTLRRLGIPDAVPFSKGGKPPTHKNQTGYHLGKETKEGSEENRRCDDKKN